MDEILKIKDLRVSFPTESGILRAVRGIDLSLGRGEVLAVVGESGSGKSVSTRAVLGILPRSAIVESGEIVYGGRDLLTLGEREMARIRGRRIAMVPQDPFTSLDPISTVGEQITEVMQSGGGRRGRAMRRERAIKLLREVGIPEPERRFHEYPFRLSGGMRQRVAIAAGLAADPEILICDEPTTALDVTIEAQILDLLMELKRTRGLSMLFITHDLGVVARIADRVAVMYAGRVVECGSVEDVFYDPRHPYTWALLSSVPTGDGSRLEAIRGAVPDMRHPPRADAFALRSDYALRIDMLIDPPTFTVREGHTVSSWLCHKDAPKIEPPRAVRERIERYRKYGRES